jgi:GNAT superfamily N-acetyltransferase
MKVSGEGPVKPEDLTIIPANRATWADLTAIFGTIDSGRCNCQRFKTRGWFWDQATDEQRRARLREQVNCDNPDATSTTGLVAYLADGSQNLDDEPRDLADERDEGDEEARGVPVGWVAVEPRTEYPRLLDLPTVWRGRHEDKQDDGVWSVTCFVVRKGYRRRGITYALAAAAVGYARENGARALEGYAMRTQPGKEITWGELHVGAVQAFADAGFTEVSSPSVRRVVMRVDFTS